MNASLNLSQEQPPERSAPHVNPLSGLTGTCARCDTITPLRKPNCCNCGLWQPWGDRAVAARRKERLAKFREDERTEEWTWQQMRREPESRAQREGLRFQVARRLHLLRVDPVGNIALNAGIAATLALSTLLIWNALPHYTPRPETRATAKCNDGTWSYAYNRAGACSGHGGVKVFYR